MSTQTFDYLIIGAGAAGLHLAIQIAEDPYFKGKSVGILDRDKKNIDDRTWSFWEVGASRWDEISENRWKTALFHSDEGKSYEIDLGAYTYKSIRSSKFYGYCKDILPKAGNLTWIEDEVVTVKKNEVEGTQGSYRADHLFDSRIDPEFWQKEKTYTSLSQHFLGWFIETPTPKFDDSRITMMDYRLQWKDHTSFTYVLPFSPSFALVEFTLFNNEMLTQEEYQQKLETYISHYLKIDEFKIVDTEQGIIPMTTYPFTKHHEPFLTKIGTAGGWVRPSSGYSFKNAERYSKMVISNLKRGAKPHASVATNRFRFFDKIFLQVLQDQNNLGPGIFEKLYTKNDINSMFRFLDEQSSLSEDIRVMLSVNQPAFRKALLKIF